MHDNRDDYEPIIADRRSRPPLREDAQPLWRLVLALAGGLVVVVLLAWWFMGRSSDGTSTAEQSESSAPEIFPEDHVEQPPAPPARDVETSADVAPSPAPPARDPEPAASAEQTEPPAAAAEQTTVPAEGVEQSEPPAQGAEQPAVPQGASEVPENEVQTPVPPAPVSVRIMSPDPQVRVELRGPLDSSTVLTSKAGEVIAVAPGTYRVVSSGTDLETFEQDVTFEGGSSIEYHVELCAEPKRERETLVGRVVEERACATTAQCESMFMVLSEHAEQLVNDRAFRTQQCAKWRADAAPEGKWTLNTDCGGATLATTCRIEIAQGACSLAGPRRSVRGSECPRGEFK
jgi:cytoskeletal protein RodZ